MAAYDGNWKNWIETWLGRWDGRGLREGRDRKKIGDCRGILEER